MANDKYNLNARIHQGYDPNTEFNTNSNLFSTLRFADNSREEAENLVEPPAQDISVTTRPAMETAASASNEAVNFSTLPPASTANPSSASSNSSVYYDPSVAEAGSAQSPEMFEGLQPQGNRNDASVLSNSLLLMPTSAAGGTSSEPSSTSEGQQPFALIAPVITTDQSISLEGNSIPLNIGLTADTRPGVVTVITISGIPLDATLSAGVNNGNGTWNLRPEDLSGLVLTPGQFYSGQLIMTVTANSTFGTQTSSDIENMLITVEGQASLPDIFVQHTTGYEDMPIGLQINASLRDLDGSETMEITVSGVPAGANLSAGIDNGNGIWTLTQNDLADLTLNPPANYSGSFDLTVTGTTYENNTTATLSRTLNVTVDGIADVPILSVTPLSGVENQPIPLSVSVTLTDTDGSESLYIRIYDAPSGSSFSSGVQIANGIWEFTQTELADLHFTPPAGYNGNLSMFAVASTSEGNTHAYAEAQIDISVSPVASLPLLETNPANGSEDNLVPLDISASVNDINGSEILTIMISGLPAGASLSNGVDNGDGTWTLTPELLSNLSLIPPLNYSGTFDLIVNATAYDGAATSSQTESLTVEIQGIADSPSLNVASATGTEGNTVPLSISAVLADIDGSETLSIEIMNVPSGFSFSAGTDNGDGSWSLSPLDLGNLELIAPSGYSGSLSMQVVATSTEDGTSEQITASLNISISPEATLPNLSTLSVSGSEDTDILLNISASLNDTDGSEILEILIAGIPAGASLSAGSDNGNGTWTLSPAQLTNLSITPPLNYSGSFYITVTATSTDGSDTAQVTSNFSVEVSGVPDTPLLSAGPAAGEENEPIELNITASLQDNDGSENLSIVISGVPAGAALSAGIDNGNGTWTMTQTQLNNLTLTPPPFYSGSFNLGVAATASENNLTTSTSVQTFSVNITPVNNVPILNILPASGNEDNAITLDIEALPFDTSGSEILTLTISNLPAGAILSAGINNGDGTWTLTVADTNNLQLIPAPDFSGNFNLDVTLSSTDGPDTFHVHSFLPVTISAIPDMPILSVQPSSGNESSPIMLDISAALTDTDGSENLSVIISGVPTGATLSAGIDTGNGVWILSASDLANLQMIPPPYFSGTIPLSVTAVASEINLSAATPPAILNVAVTGSATTPNLLTSPATGSEDTPIALNISSSLNDSDSETLIITISGMPANSSLSAGTDNGNGTWTLTAGQLTNLTFNPPANFSGSFNLTVTSASFENTTSASISSILPVTVHGEADTPSLSAQPAFGSEDTPVTLSIITSLNDTDGSEFLSILVSGIPAGANLSAGLNNGDGSWSLSPAQLTGLTLTPPENFAGIIALQVTAIATENNGDDQSVSVPLTVTIEPIADTPDLTVSAAAGQEDTPINLSISALLGDQDNSETLSITIGGVPSGAVLSAGINQGNGNWLLTQNQLANLTIIPPANSDADFTLSVSVTSTDSNGATTSVLSNLPVTVYAVADISTVIASNTSGAKNTAVSVNIGGSVTDTDGSETITYLISGVPDGFSLNHGINNGNNSWTLTPGELSGLKMISPYNFEGRVYLNAQSVAHDHDGSTTMSTATNFNIGVGNTSNGIQINLGLGIGIAGINLGTALGVNLNTGGLLSPGGIVVQEDSIFPIVDAGLLLTLAGNISLLTFSGLPVGASLSSGIDQGNGQWKLLPGDLANLSLRLPPNSDQDFTISISAKLLFVTVTLAVTDVHVIGVADTPSLSVNAVTGIEDGSAIPISVTSSLTDTDGSEKLTFMIKDLPAGFTPTVGINNGNGTWSLTSSEIALLSIQPPEHFSGDASFTIVAISTEREGDSITQTATAHIHIDPAADAPVVEGIIHQATEDTPLLLDLGISLGDTDGSEIISNIVISGLAPGFSLEGAVDNGDGTWTIDPANINGIYLHPPEDWSGHTSFSVTANSQEIATGQISSTTSTQNIYVEAAADTPNIAAMDSTGLENHNIELDISISSNDSDGSENLSVVISDVPDYFTFSSGLNNGNGSWSFSEDQLDDLYLIPQENFTGDVHLNIDVFAQDDNSVAVSHADIIVHVTPDT
ncbi:MAG: hypothetical protein DI586_06245 [Micavibrio aeruginosavorus]|uniref:Cadherin domain-containing protein n=1 Tax=Micavibrio aeruginosavorus TaxID=349221 RepID=A0A2W5HIX7_9BACT|nr:MAG: hypothetical protein DI586_06245 [Micavibrio aeruginosavorus]